MGDRGAVVMSLTLVAGSALLGVLIPLSPGGGP